MALSLETYVKLLKDSGIVGAEVIDEALTSQNNLQSAEDLALALIRGRKLSRFQAEEISKGKGKSLVLGNYVLIERIGAGDMGQVFKARHKRMDRFVAIKVLPRELTKDFRKANGVVFNKVFNRENCWAGSRFFRNCYQIPLRRVKN